ncbi:AbrB/MazE/SpoVT family DNA-binding domain-containing protein [Amycolatopsis sp. NPDC051045]|uniref:AbrB/MazE/SpoVT family DNA-binding domain-containing protein n=1 Tax=Amycolatopsis sp. NPDC051045 TaxID=3156922 RepID=UPI0034123F47
MWPLLDRLGWHDDVRLTVTVVGTSLLMRRDPAGVFELGKRRMVVLPIVLRRRCGISAGDDVFMVADPARGVLVVHPARALDQMVTSYHASLAGGDRDDR